MPPPLAPGLLALAETQHGVLLAGQVTGVLGDRLLARLTRHGVLVRLWRGAYALPSRATDAATRLEAARLTLGRPVIACLHTGAQMHGFDISNDSLTHVLSVQDWPGDLRQLVAHRFVTRRPPVTIGAFQVCDAAETAVRVACREKNPAKALAALDAALSAGRVKPPELAGVADEMRIRGIRLVRELIPLADGRAESPGESWMRWVCIEAGFPPPTPQVWVTLANGQRRRIDLGWEELRVGCEYDGVQFHTGAALHDDRGRYNALGRLGWLMHGVTNVMIWQERPALVADIGSLLRQRSA